MTIFFAESQSFVRCSSKYIVITLQQKNKNKTKTTKTKKLETKVMPLHKIRFLKISFFCAACEAWSAQRDKSPSSSALSHFWFPIDNLQIVASISFKLYRRVKHYKLQVKFSSGGHPQNFD